MNISVILSGGKGERFGSREPKQYHSLNGKEVIGYVVDTLKQSIQTDKILIVASRPLDYDADYVQGGKTHNESVRNGLDYIRENYPCKNVLFVDSARPFITAQTVDLFFSRLSEYEAVITAQHITDSLGKNGEQFVERAEYYLIQKPEAFRFDMLYDCFDAESARTAIVQQLPVNTQLYKCFDIGMNMKITYPDDLVIAEQLMKMRGAHV